MAIKFHFPVDGDFVNSRDGIWRDGALVIDVLVESDCRQPEICGVPAVYDASLGCYRAKTALYGWRNRITARTPDGEYGITVFVMPEENLKKYRISSDDNIRFLQELTDGDYKSIFDHPYLAVYKKAHDLYGAKVHLNLFYAFDDTARSRFSDKPDYFDLSMMTDRYKKEFMENSHWLKLAFHSRSEFPDRPYRNADGKTVREDCVAVCREICRFAGKNSISDSTTIHWGAANREVVRALRTLGFTALAGYFTKSSDGELLVSYYADGDTVDHVGTRDFWMDTAEDMIFGRIDTVLNLDTFENVLRSVKTAAGDPHRGGFVSLMIHEQYFYPGYRKYLPDFEERVLQSCRLLAESGYTGAHISEVTHQRALADYPAFFKTEERPGGNLTEK